MASMAFQRTTLSLVSGSSRCAATRPMICPVRMMKVPFGKVCVRVIVSSARSTVTAAG